jgi:N-acetylglucosamine repressor
MISRAKSGSNLKEVKLINRAVVFRAIREAGGNSRADLAKKTGLNPATLTHITRELLARGLVAEAGSGEARVGRRSSLLRIHPHLGHIVAVRLSRHNIQGLITDLDLRELINHTAAASFLTQPIEVSAPAVLEVIETLIAKSGVARQSILGIGISAPGPLDARRGILIAPPNFPGWVSAPLREIVAAQTGFATFLDNDANSAALAEKWFGAGRAMDNFVYLLVEDGVGGGVVINGDLYRGEHDIAGELGHMTIDRHGPVCDCGNTGCLELYAAPSVAENRLRQAVRAGQPTQVAEWVGPDDSQITFEMVVRAARLGDGLAREALVEIAQALGVAAVNISNTFDPQAIILGGKICLAADVVLPIIQECVNRQAFSRRAQPMPVIMSELGANAPVIGAFSLVLRELFQNPEFHLAGQVDD